MILFVGILILLFFDLWEKPPVRIIYMTGFLIFVLLGNQIPGFCIEQMSGIEIDKGNSKWAHVAMGLQESDMAPGWYNCYNENLFIAKNYDTEETAREALSSIKASLRNFASHPSYAWEFFHKKLASEWNNPTFECFHIQNSRNTSLELSGFILSTINDGGKVNILLIYGLDILQSVLLFGILMYFLHTKDTDGRLLIWAILFIGAFLFWMFWEAKSRYVAPYFMFLFPYSFMGYKIVAERFREKRIYLSLCVLALCIMFIGSSNAFWVKSAFKIQGDTEDYYEYIHQYNHNFMNLRF